MLILIVSGYGFRFGMSINAGALNDVWFGTKQGLVGSYDTETAEIKTLILAAGEEVHNSFSNTLSGQAGIATNEALYLIALDEQGELMIQWRAQYDWQGTVGGMIRISPK